MEPREMSRLTNRAQDEREWELADEELDRTAKPSAQTTSRPCVCQVCSSPQHCR